MAVLDAIIKATLVENQSVSIDFESEPFDISKAESGFAISVELANGISTDVDFELHVSVDGQGYSLQEGTHINFTDTEGGITWDVLDTQTCFVKLVAIVNTGSIDIVKAILSAKRRH